MLALEAALATAPAAAPEAAPAAEPAVAPAAAPAAFSAVPPPAAALPVAPAAVLEVAMRAQARADALVEQVRARAGHGDAERNAIDWLSIQLREAYLQPDSLTTGAPAGAGAFEQKLDPVTLYLHQALMDASAETSPRGLIARMQSFRRTLYDALTPRTPQFTPRTGGARRIERVRADAAGREARMQVSAGGEAGGDNAAFHLDLGRSQRAGGSASSDLKSPVLSDRSSKEGSPRSLAQCRI